MSDFSHILVPFDNSPPSKAALKTAIDLSKVFGSQITSVYVNIGKKDKTAEVKEAIAEVNKTYSKEVTLVLPTGKMYKEVVRTAEDVQADAIVMGSHGSSARDMFFIGSNAYRVVSSSHIPVITLPESFTSGVFKKIVVPIDQSKETRQKIPMVAELAKKFNSKVHLFGTSKYDDDESRLKVKQYISQSIDLLKESEVETSTSTLFGKNIAKATLEWADNESADLIVMMAESEPSSGLFMGTNAQQVVNRSSVPVLTLHAKDVGITYAGY
jgi:nucleotide-binding universal stress UspA family protein